MHPQFKSLVPPEEKEVESFFQSLRGFRPVQNILELTGTLLLCCAVTAVAYRAHSEEFEDRRDARGAQAEEAPRGGEGQRSHLLQ